MPSLEIYNNINEYKSTPTTIGQQLKNNSDRYMEDIWENDIATRQCYIYDYAHDDNPEERIGYDPSLSSAKIPVSLKFIIKSYKSAVKDDPEYHIQFRPSDWNSYRIIPDWYEQYSKLDIDFPIGLYVDIPDDRGVYSKWLIVYKEDANQFPKFGVLKCNYYFMWITKDTRIKRHIWGVQRNQSSYNSGIYTYDYTTKMENQAVGWLPYNNISCELFYNQRIIVSMPIKQPLTWQITKIENTKPKGICQFTLYQNEFNPTKDYVSDDYSEMYADYYIDSIINDDSKSDSSTISTQLVIKCATTSLKLHGGYKSLSAIFTDKDGKDISDSFSNILWTFYIDDKDAVSENLIETSKNDTRKIKIKFVESENCEDYIGKIIKVCCTADSVYGELLLHITSL